MRWRMSAQDIEKEGAFYEHPLGQLSSMLLGVLLIGGFLLVYGKEHLEQRRIRAALHKQLIPSCAQEGIQASACEALIKRRDFSCFNSVIRGDRQDQAQLFRGYERCMLGRVSSGDAEPDAAPPQGP